MALKNDSHARKKKQENNAKEREEQERKKKGEKNRRKADARRAGGRLKEKARRRRPLASHEARAYMTPSTTGLAEMMIRLWRARAQRRRRRSTRQPDSKGEEKMKSGFQVCLDASAYLRSSMFASNCVGAGSPLPFVSIRTHVPSHQLQT